MRYTTGCVERSIEKALPDRVAGHDGSASAFLGVTTTTLSSKPTTTYYHAEAIGSHTHTMASALRPALLRQAFHLQRPNLTTALPAFRSRVLAPAVTQRAAFQTSTPRSILPPLPQTIEGGVNEPAKVPDPEPSHGSYHWTAERYGHRYQ